ncbi:MAG: polysaccharide deacetylase [Clostridia bacterium]|nr:polysaccharide deacetylase [Clostridia bacterium]MDE7214925.1 polysaccharide deacetylase [Clostridia bacterium]
MNKNFTAVCAALLMCAMIFIFYGTFVLGNNVTFAEEACQKEIYLTFDDGPSDKVTPKILDVLKEENVKATFFIIGKNAETRKNLLKRAADEGHTVAVHSYSHVYKEIYASPESLLNDIEKCNDIIESVTGKRANVYRFPGGSFGLDEKLISAVTNFGMRYVDWNASTRDAELTAPTPEQLYSAAVTTPADRNRVVLLAHDSTTKTTTAKALKSIIKYYREKGYSFETF